MSDIFPATTHRNTDNRHWIRFKPRVKLVWCLPPTNSYKADTGHLSLQPIHTSLSLAVLSKPPSLSYFKVHSIL
jgi:hypothetical protein